MSAMHSVTDGRPFTDADDRLLLARVHDLERELETLRLEKIGRASCRERV